MTALRVALLVLTLSTVALARPGGGQSFRSSTPSYDSSSSSSSSSGSSWGSSDSSSSSSSSGSSWWSSGRSSSSSSSSDTSSGSSYESYEPSYRSTADYDRILAESRCIQGCMGKPYDELSKCFDDCKSAPVREATDEERGRYRSRSTVRQPPPDPPLALHFWIPGIVLGLFSAGAAVNYLMKKRDERFWAAIGAVDDSERELAFLALQRNARMREPNIRAALRTLQSKDDAFSWVLFEDFLHSLYIEAHTLRGQGKLALLAPYFTSEALALLARLPKAEVSAIVVGSTETIEVLAMPTERDIRVQVGFEANYTEGAQSYAVREVWTLVRGADIVSRPPKRARVIGCPSCGGPLDKLVGDTCEHCGAPSAPGSRDWQVVEIQVQARESRPPQLTGTTEEEGTDLPTLTAPDLKGEFGALAVRDPEFSWAAFQQRVEHVFHTFHEAWVAQDLAPVRAYFSDQLFEAQRYWVSAYQAQGLRNVTEDRQLVSIALSRLLHDKYFDAITVRVFAQCKDFTLDRSGNLVGGSRDTLRRYSEYWTFIRSVDERGASRKDPSCPSCGAPIQNINMAGDCGSCGVHVTTGEFDWVLSRIEQDEVYRL